MRDLRAFGVDEPAPIEGVEKKMTRQSAGTHRVQIRRKYGKPAKCKRRSPLPCCVLRPPNRYGQRYRSDRTRSATCPG
jgi:hypothetical protein